jgi:hypothetical protein
VELEAPVAVVRHTSKFIVAARGKPIATTIVLPIVILCKVHIVHQRGIIAASLQNDQYNLIGWQQYSPKSLRVPLGAVIFVCKVFGTYLVAVNVIEIGLRRCHPCQCSQPHRESSLHRYHN